MAAKDEDGNVNADDNLAEAEEMDELLEDISDALLYFQDEEELLSPSSGKLRMGGPLNTRYKLITKESATEAPVKNDGSLPDDEDVTSSIDYTSSEYDRTRDRLKRRFSRLPIKNDDDSKELSKIDPSSSSDHLEAEHVQYGGTHEPVNQPMPTRESTSSPGPSPSVSMTKALLTSTDFVPKRKQQALNLPQTQRNLPQIERNQQAMNLPQTQRNLPQTGRNQQAMNQPQAQRNLPQTQRNPQAMNLPQTQRNPRAMNPQYSNQWQVPSGQYGNITRPTYLPSPYWRPEQNDIHNIPAYVDPYGTMVTSPPYWLPQPNDIYNMPQFDPSVVPHVVSVVHYPYDSANRFGTLSDNNPADSRFGYEAGVSSNHLPSMQHHHQGGDLDAWRPNEQNRQIWDDVSAYVDQQNDRSDDPSDQTQQRSPPRDN